MPFGRHAGRPLRRVPLPYLAWFLDTHPTLPESLRQALVRELATREDDDGGGIEETWPVVPVRDLVRCRDCGLRPVVRREVDRLGRPRLRGTCPLCRAHVDFPPLAGYAAEADANAELDALEDRGVSGPTEGEEPDMTTRDDGATGANGTNGATAAVEAGRAALLARCLRPDVFRKRPGVCEVGRTFHAGELVVRGLPPEMPYELFDGDGNRVGTFTVEQVALVSRYAKP
jgi:hypothetical protein